MAEKTPPAFHPSSIKKRKREILRNALEQVIFLSGEVAELNLLADMSEGTGAEFGCGLDHLRDGLRDTKAALLGLVEDD